MCIIAGTFGVFQAVMPMTGWVCVHTIEMCIRDSLNYAQKNGAVVSLSDDLPQCYVQDMAVRKLKETKGCKVEKVSSYLVTPPYGFTEQEDFLNACLELKTLLMPGELLARLHEIEQEAGRERVIHWGPRTLDLDIIFYDDMICQEETLCIPHVEMHKRKFVLAPLHEIAPYKRHPVYGKTVREMLEELG